MSPRAFPSRLPDPPFPWRLGANPLIQDFAESDALTDEGNQPVWSKCGKAHAVTITTVLHAKAKGVNGQGYAVIGVDLQDGLLVLRLALPSRKCR